MSEDKQKKTDDKSVKSDEELAAIKEAVREQAREDESPDAASFSLRRILAGEFLFAAMMRRHIGIILLIVAFIIVYISNRYSCQKALIEIDRLEKELVDAKYKALSSSSELTEMCRESKVIEMLRHSKDSMLTVPKQPPYVIKKKNDK